jgi:hypothetical protein
MPVGIEKHYIFGLLACFICWTALLPKIPSSMVMLCTLAVWLQPANIQPRYSPAKRTIQDLESCAHTICQKMQAPLFVSMESGLIGYHNAPEHRYFLRRAGCNVHDIETEAGNSQIRTMLVMLDSSAPYTHGKSSSNELTLFGTSTQKETIVCFPQLKAVVLERE